MPDSTKKAKRAAAKQALQDAAFDNDRLALRVQYGALGYRSIDRGGIEILLITSRNTKRWIIPKGWPIKGLKPCDSAAQEAFEEAGVRGKVARRPLGKYIYSKLLKAGSKAVPCELQVYALEIHKQEKRWPEAGQREIKWFRPEEAIAVADEAELSKLIVAFIAHRAKSASIATAPEKRSSKRQKFGGKHLSLR